MHGPAGDGPHENQEGRGGGRARPTGPVKCLLENLSIDSLISHYRAMSASESVLPEPECTWSTGPDDAAAVPAEVRDAVDTVLNTSGLPRSEREILTTRVERW